MKVLNICQSDWSNFSEDNAYALRAAGVFCTSLKEKAHVFSYDRESQIATANEMLLEIEKHDVIQVMHTDLKMLNLCKMADHKRVIVYHTGTAYRKEPDKMNAAFNPHVVLSMTDQCEFMALGAKNVQYIATAVDTKNIKPGKNVYGVYQLGHYPSCSKTKGSDVIIEAVKKVHARTPTFNFHYSDERLRHSEQINRMQRCDVYIELFAPKQDGKPYGCFGVTAFEAGALGKVVLTQNIFQEVYEKTYGQCALIICNTEKQLEQELEVVLKKSPKEIVYLQRQTRAWAEEKHSYLATGQRLKKILQSL